MRLFRLGLSASIAALLALPAQAQSLETVLDLVPLEMNESFPATVDRGSGRARYSNFRKFQTSGRIVPPPP